MEDAAFSGAIFFFAVLIHAEIFSCVSDSGQFIVCTEFGSFPGAIEGIHFELQRPKYFVNLYIVLYRVAGFPPGPKNFISMFSLWAAVGGDREMGKWCRIKRKRLIEVWLHPQVRPHL